jgi:hypothetical protein
MKRLALLTLTALSLAACAPQPGAVPAAPTAATRTYPDGPVIVTVGQTSSSVQLLPGNLSAVFSWRDDRGLSATNNLYPGPARVIPSGSRYGLKVSVQ